MNGQLINLIVIIVVIGSLIKRFMEVTNKGRELTDDEKRQQLEASEAARKAVARGRGMDGRRGQEVSIPRQQPAPSRQPEIRTLDDLVRTLSGQELASRQDSVAPQEPEHVPVKEPAVDVYAEEARADERIARIRERRNAIMKKKSAPKRIRGLRLGFGGGDLVRGIVMNEILSPPVALRQEGH
jgi:hypothetical protein